MNIKDNEKNDIIDAEFVNLSEDKSKKTQNIEDDIGAYKELDKYNFNINNNEKFRDQRPNSFNSYFYSFQSKEKIKLQKISLFKLILLLPFLLLAFSIFIFFGLIAFVIFLPKIYKFFRKKGISGLKMDYNFIRGLFSHFRVK